MSAPGALGDCVWGTTSLGSSSMSSPENPKLKAMLYVCGCASARVHVNVGILFVQSLSIARATLSGECPRVDEHGAQREYFSR